MIDQERHIVENTKSQYYANNWKSVLMTMMRYKKPMVANAHQLTEESLKHDSKQPFYMFLAWLKPGRHTFVISHRAGGQEKPNNTRLSLGKMGLPKTISAPPPQPTSLSALMAKLKPPKQDYSTQTFYVHEMLATFRDEKIPFCK